MVAWEAMQMEAQRNAKITKPSLSSSSTAAKRKPLSDLSNDFNITPTSTIRKLCPHLSSSSPSKSPHNQTPFPKSQPKPKSYSNLRPKSCLNSSTQTNNLPLGSAYSSESADTSIQFSKYSSVNAQKLGITVPQYYTPPPPSTSSTGPGNEDHCKVNSSRQTAEKSLGKRKVAVVPSSLPLQKIQGKEKEVAGPPIDSPLPEVKDKNKTMVSPLGSAPSGKADNERKAVDISLGLPGGRTKDRGKAIAMSFGCSSMSLEKLERKEKEVFGPFICPPLPEAKAVSSHFGGASSEKADDKGKTVDNPSSFSGGKTKDKGKAIAILDSPKRESKAFLMAASCPPLPRTRHAGNETHNDTDVEFPTSWSHPQPKRRKKRSRQQNGDAAKYALPKDFIEKQRAYFKEVDEFELPEEVVSDDELD